MLVCGYYAVRLLYFKDISSIRPAGREKVRDEEGYMKYAGYLITGLGVSVLIMMLIRSLNVIAGYAWMLVAFIVFTVLWKRMNDRFGG